MYDRIYKYLQMNTNIYVKLYHNISWFPKLTQQFFRASCDCSEKGSPSDKVIFEIAALFIRFKHRPC